MSLQGHSHWSIFFEGRLSHLEEPLGFLQISPRDSLYDIRDSSIPLLGGRSDGSHQLGAIKIKGPSFRSRLDLRVHSWPRLLEVVKSYVLWLNLIIISLPSRRQLLGDNSGFKGIVITLYRVLWVNSDCWVLGVIMSFLIHDRLV